MDLQKIKDKWKGLIIRLAEYGIPILMLRDPFVKKPSLPFTMIILAIVLVVIGMVGKLSVLVGGVDKGSAESFLTTSAALYFGHSFVNQKTEDASGRVEETELETDKPAKDQ